MHLWIHMIGQSSNSLCMTSHNVIRERQSLLPWKPPRVHVPGGRLGVTIDSREQGWATQSAPPVLLYYFILCLPVVHPG